MVSNIGRVMTILTTMFSVAFMAFAISRWATIPDWASEARQLEDFRITRTEGETPSWSAVTRRSEEAVATSVNIAEVLEKMYQKSTQDTQAKRTELNNLIPILEADIEQAKSSSAADAIGIDNRVKEMLAQLEQMESEVARLTTEAEREKANAQKIQLERERRRSDVFRLREELAQMQEDTFRAEQIQAELIDKIRRTQGAVVKLQTRQKALQETINATGPASLTPQQ